MKIQFYCSDLLEKVEGTCAQLGVEVILLEDVCDDR